jgi:hypothetical protein
MNSCTCRACRPCQPCAWSRTDHPVLFAATANGALSLRRTERRAARGCQQLSASLAIPTTAGQTGGQSVCLCIDRARGERPHMPLSVLVGAPWVVVAFEPFQEPASPVDVCCDRGFLQPSRTQLMLEAAELRAKLCRRVALAARRAYWSSWRDCADGHGVSARRICRRRWDPASGARDLRRRAGCVDWEGK